VRRARAQRLGALPLLALLLAACKDSRPATPADAPPAPAVDAPAADLAPAPPAAPDRQRVLSDLVRLVLVPGYQQLAAEGPRLTAALASLRDAPGADTLQAARQAWRAARAAWRRTTAFGIGPGDDLAVTGGVIDEPTAPDKLEALLAGAGALDATAIRSLPANVRGLLALEHLLFDPDASDDQVVQRLSGEAAIRRRLLASLLAEELSARFMAIADGWTGRFAREVEEAGRGGSVFVRERDAYDNFMNKALAVVDRTIDSVRAGAGGPPPQTPPPISLRSDNVSADVMDDLRGFQAAYLGRGSGGQGLAIADVVRAMSPMADDEMRASIEQALVAVAALPRPLRAAGVTSPPVAQAITALRLVKLRLATGVFSAMGVSVGFSDNDGD